MMQDCYEGALPAVGENARADRVVWYLPNRVGVEFSMLRRNNVCRRRLYLDS